MVIKLHSSTKLRHVPLNIRAFVWCISLSDESLTLSKPWLWLRLRLRDPGSVWCWSTVRNAHCSGTDDRDQAGAYGAGRFGQGPFNICALKLPFRPIKLLPKKRKPISVCVLFDGSLNGGHVGLKGASDTYNYVNICEFWQKS